jgi:hypothetical protein
MRGVTADSESTVNRQERVDMTTSFKTTELTGDRTLVEGTDVNGVTGKTVLSNAQFKDLWGNSAHDAAHKEFDAAVEKFYAPLNKAIDKLKAAHESAVAEDLYTEVVGEDVAPTAGSTARRIRLSQDTVILRLIAQGKTDRLVWVNDQLEITAA